MCVAAKVAQGATARQSLHRSHVSAAASAASKEPGALCYVSHTYMAAIYITPGQPSTICCIRSPRASLPRLQPFPFPFLKVSSINRLPTSILESWNLISGLSVTLTWCRDQSPKLFVTLSYNLLFPLNVYLSVCSYHGRTQKPSGASCPWRWATFEHWLVIRTLGCSIYYIGLAHSRRNGI